MIQLPKRTQCANKKGKNTNEKYFDETEREIHELSEGATHIFRHSYDRKWRKKWITINIFC